MMPLLHCNACHHEWEGKAESKCGWCGAESYVLQPKTGMEMMLEGWSRYWEAFVERMRCT